MVVQPSMHSSLTVFRLERINSDIHMHSLLTPVLAVQLFNTDARIQWLYSETALECSFSLKCAKLLVFHTEILQ